MSCVRKQQMANSWLLALLMMTTICNNHRSNCNATTVITSAGSNQSEFKRTPKMFKENCTCSTQWQCKCCAKVNNDLLNVHQTLCAEWLIFPNSWNIQANVRLNNNVLYANTFSAWNMPPFCVPIWPAIALTGCLQIHSITQHDYNNTLHGCANVTINFITFNLVNFQMGCADVGTDGIQFVEANHHEAAATGSTEKPPEIELETNDLIKVSTFSPRQQNEDDAIRPATIRQDSLTYLMSKNF